MIDGGPLRTSRPTGRQVSHHDESVRYQPEEPPKTEAVMPSERQPERHAHTQHQQVEYQPAEAPQRVKESPKEPKAPKEPKNFSWVKWPIILLVIVALGVAGWMYVPMGGSVAATIDDDKYQAVFLSNGQVYFGNLSIVNGDYMELTNVYYLERQLTATDTETEDETEAEPTAGENNFQLLKYSDVLYGSEDAMIISKDDIIRFENLRNDGVVAKAIANRN